MKPVLLLLPILSGIMWGAAGVFVRTLSDYGMDSTTIVFSRVSLATLMMLALILVADRRWLRFERRDAWIFIACAIAMLGLNAFYTVSVDALTLSLAAVLLSLSPVFMLVMAAFLFRERVTARKILCMLTSIVGCVLVSGLLESGSSLSASGIAAGLAAAFFYALYGILSKRSAASGYSTYTTLFYCLLISTLVLLPFTDMRAFIGFAAEGAWGTGYLILNAAVASFLPYILYTTAMARMEGGTASILAAAGEPTAAAVFGAMFFTEIPSPLMLLGMVLAIGSMALMCMPSESERSAS
ncbi:EamA family transporter [Methanomassiliicoccaceae archaeon DOK]|nr:EamA family transporter [Methanomassiliicoccaceae archaeon DOK]